MALSGSKRGDASALPNDPADWSSGIVLAAAVADVVAAPTVRLFLPSGTGDKAIIDTRTPAVVGTAPAGAAVTVSVNGQAQGPVSFLPGGGSGAETTETFTAPMSTPLPLGQTTIDVAATAASAADTARTESALSVFVLSDPVGGVTTASATSADLTNLLGQGYRFEFINDTTALRLTDGTVAFGASTPAALVERLYQGLLGQGSEAGTLARYAGQLAAGGAATDIVNTLINSFDYAIKHGLVGNQTDAQFVATIYQGFLHRDADPRGQATLLQQLSSGMSRADVVLELAQSDEAKTVFAADTRVLWELDPAGNFVTKLYEAGYGRAPDPAGLAVLKQQFAAGMSATALAQEIVATPEFAAVHASQTTQQLVDGFYAAAGAFRSIADRYGGVWAVQAGNTAELLGAVVTSGVRPVSPGIFSIYPA